MRRVRAAAAVPARQNVNEMVLRSKPASSRYAMWSRSRKPPRCEIQSARTRPEYPLCLAMSNLRGGRKVDFGRGIARQTRPPIAVNTDAIQKIAAKAGGIEGGPPLS